MLTLTDYDPEYSNLSGWYYCEKLDGVRAEWDGRRLWTRTGHRIDAPAAWLARLPQGLAISGELWLGRGRLGDVAGAVNAGGGCPLWGQMRLVAFDLPELALSIPALARKMDDCHLDRVDFIPVAGGRVGRVDLEARLRQVVDGGGEGLVLRSPDGRIGLKYKLWRDAEATVLAAVPGKKSVRCRADNGAEFCLATYGRAVAAGARVTYKFTEILPSGKPRFPVFLEVRDYEGEAE
jgi:DNA ligase-1